MCLRGDATGQTGQALMAQVAQLGAMGAAQQPQDPQPGSQPAAASGSGQANQEQQAAAPTALSAAQPSAGDQAGPSQANPSRTGGRRSPPHPALFRTPAQPPSASDAARGLAQVLGDNTRAGRITSAMFGSAMEAAMTAARQVMRAQIDSCFSSPGLLVKIRVVANYAQLQRLPACLFWGSLSIQPSFLSRHVSVHDTHMCLLCHGPCNTRPLQLASAMQPVVRHIPTTYVA